MSIDKTTKLKIEELNKGITSKDSIIETLEQERDMFKDMCTYQTGVIKELESRLNASN